MDFCCEMRLDKLSPVQLITSLLVIQISEDQKDRIVVVGRFSLVRS